MRAIILFCFIILVSLNSCSEGKTLAEIETDFGTITIELYESTPLHKENFIKLVKEGFYDDLLFHRVMQGFMIQGGDPNSRGAAPEVRLGSGGPGYKIPAEIGAPHFKGALAAARQPDTVNPEQQSSGSQFYLVHGTIPTAQMLDVMETQKGITYNESQRAKYLEIGGRPDLDMDYTVFGEVVDGLDVIDKIAAVATKPDNRPIEDVKMKVRIK